MRKVLCLLICICMLLSQPMYASASRTGLPGLDAILPGLGDLLPDQEGDPSAHTHSYDILISDSATCSAPGVAIYACSCGEQTERYSEATGDHAYGGYEYADTNSHTSTCRDCGTEVRLNHSWDGGRTVTEANCNQSGEQVFTCKDCGGIYSRQIPRTDHDYEPSISDDIQHICRICGKGQSHYWDEGEVTRRPTCKNEGIFSKYCVICDMTLEETLDRLTTHTYDSACDPECNVCGSKREIEHTFSVTWSKNYKGHWYECTKCGEQKQFSQHNPGPEASEKEEQICLVCKYVIQPKKNHVHSYEKQRSYDEVGHWFECKGCGNEKEYASHRFDDDCDPDCKTCGYVRENAHSFGDNWKMSNFEHWMECAICSEESKREKHIPGPEASEQAAQVCTVCSFEIAPKQEHIHDFGAEWSGTEDMHWQVCSCGEESVPQSHVWDAGEGKKNGTILYTCMECKTEKTVETPTSGISGVVLILILLAFVCGGGIAALLIILKQGKFREERQDFTNRSLNVMEESEEDSMYP